MGEMRWALLLCFETDAGGQLWNHFWLLLKSHLHAGPLLRRLCCAGVWLLFRRQGEEGSFSFSQGFKLNKKMKFIFSLIFSLCIPPEAFAQSSNHVVQPQAQPWWTFVALWTRWGALCCWYHHWVVNYPELNHFNRSWNCPSFWACALVLGK